MHIARRRGWEIPESHVTPEAAMLNRRGLLAGAGALSIAGALPARAEPNPKFAPGRALTEEKYATSYNNYYEFNDSKNVVSQAQALKQRPWTIALGGLVKTPRTIDLDDLLKQVQSEERIYRHRCVETWAMTVPWTGFSLAQLLKLAEPLGSAKYVMFETVQDKAAMPGLSSPFYTWPYIEGLAIDEAANDLAFMVTGLYGKPVPPQNGGPLRVALPWKYGFKSAKSIVKITFTEKRPVTFWEGLQSSEYGFWANVNPDVPHRRWSQAHERLLGSNESVPTQLYNGYADFVAGLYEGRKSEKLFM
jgi:sulfoxide reductase catalytic subunit YedY